MFQDKLVCDEIQPRAPYRCKYGAKPCREIKFILTRHNLSHEWTVVWTDTLFTATNVHTLYLYRCGLVGVMYASLHYRESSSFRKEHQFFERPSSHFHDILLSERTYHQGRKVVKGTILKTIYNKIKMHLPKEVQVKAGWCLRELMKKTSSYNIVYDVHENLCRQDKLSVHNYEVFPLQTIRPRQRVVLPTVFLVARQCT